MIKNDCWNAVMMNKLDGLMEKRKYNTFMYELVHFVPTYKKMINLFNLQ